MIKSLLNIIDGIEKKFNIFIFTFSIKEKKFLENLLNQKIEEKIKNDFPKIFSIEEFKEINNGMIFKKEKKKIKKINSIIEIYDYLLNSKIEFIQKNNSFKNLKLSKIIFETINYAENFGIDLFSIPEQNKNFFSQDYKEIFEKIILNFFKKSNYKIFDEYIKYIFFNISSEKNYIFCDFFLNSKIEAREKTRKKFLEMKKSFVKNVFLLDFFNLENLEKKIENEENQNEIIELHFENNFLATKFLKNKINENCNKKNIIFVNDEELKIRIRNEFNITKIKKFKSSSIIDAFKKIYEINFNVDFLNKILEFLSSSIFFKSEKVYLINSLLKKLLKKNLYTFIDRVITINNATSSEILFIIKNLFNGYYENFFNFTEKIIFKNKNFPQNFLDLFFSQIKSFNEIIDFFLIDESEIINVKEKINEFSNFIFNLGFNPKIKNGKEYFNLVNFFTEAFNNELTEENFNSSKESTKIFKTDNYFDILSDAEFFFIFENNFPIKKQNFTFIKFKNIINEITLDILNFLLSHNDSKKGNKKIYFIKSSDEILIPQLLGIKNLKKEKITYENYFSIKNKNKLHENFLFEEKKIETKFPEKLSISAIQLLNDSPLNFYMKYILKIEEQNLYFKKSKSDFGNIMHFVLNIYTKEKYYEKYNLIDFFEKNFIYENYAKQNFILKAKKIFESLSKTFSSEIILSEVLLEKKIIFEKSSEKSSYTIFGKADRIDFFDNENSKKILIIDYKTGVIPSNKKINELESLQMPLLLFLFVSNLENFGLKVNENNLECVDLLFFEIKNSKLEQKIINLNKDKVLKNVTQKISKLLSLENFSENS